MASRRTAAISAQVRPPCADVGACGACNTPRAARRSATTMPSLRQAFKPQACSASDEDSYSWRSVHKDLEADVYAGSYGWDHAAYWGIAEAKAGVDLRAWYKTRTEAEFYLPDYKELIDNPETQKDWDNIVTFDPLGMYAHPPTVAACQARLDIPELKDLVQDGVIVNSNNEIVTSKAAVSYAWNLPRLSKRLDLTEQQLRDALFKYSHDPKLLDPKVRTYIPAVGGCTCYIFGDARKLRDPKTEVSVRVHDECIGSDVFGSDICSCRPYLIFALKHCIETAQRGGVGVVVYYRKEGRSLGEVIKFRVYNARINQEGGDRADQYFNHTEQIAGIRDARFQTMMPDVLNWLGIRRIDWLCSMSNEKYEAIVGAGIKVMQRVSLPEDYIKESMMVELEAKIASGYHSDSQGIDKLAAELGDLSAIRRQCGRIYEIAKKDGLDFFAMDESKLGAAVDATEKVMREHYPDLKVPNHSRLRHFGGDKQLSQLVESWPCDKIERARRLVDLVTISVLLDAGAGPDWQYIAPGGESFKASEGLGIASLQLFLEGMFSSDVAMKHRANSVALKGLTDERLALGLQVSRANPIVGLKGRAQLLRKLGEVLESKPEFFGRELPRPGNLVDYVLAQQGEKKGEVQLEHIWRCLSEGLGGIWPLQPNGVLRGDIWNHSKLNDGRPGSDLVPFHKLTQWLAYSLCDALSLVLGIKVIGEEKLTCLAEYRNGGLLVDTGVLRLKDQMWLSQEVNVGTELVVEWRALTVVLIDHVATELRRRLGLTVEQLPLAKVLEGGTWRAGRVVAAAARPNGPPPISIRSTGAVF